METATPTATSTPTLIRLGVWSGVLAGLLIALTAMVEAVIGETAPTSFLLGLAPALAIPLLGVLHLRQSHRTGAFGAFAYTLNLVGLGLFGGAAFMLNMGLFYLDEPVLDELLQGPTKLALLGSAGVFTVGSVLFGITMVSARILPRIPALLYIAALPVLALAARLPDTVLTSCLHVISGTTLVWLAAASVPRSGAVRPRRPVVARSEPVRSAADLATGATE